MVTRARSAEAEAIRKKQEAWESKNQEAFKRERKKEFINDDGVTIKRVYTPADLEEAGFDYLKDLGFPGEYPYTRGIYPSMYRADLPETAQLVGFATVEETNKLVKYLIKHGLQKIHVCPDYPTIMGYDSDDPRAKHDVGKCGYAADSLQDYEILTDGLTMTETSWNFVNCPTGIVILAMHLAVAEKRGIPEEKLLVNPQVDGLKAIIAMDNPVFPPEAAVRLSADMIYYLTKNVPESLFWAPCVYQYAEGGGNRIQQIAYPLAVIKAYTRGVLLRGAGIDQFAHRFRPLAYVNHTDFLAEICKMRATRRLFARIMKEDFGARPESCILRAHNAHGGLTMVRDPLELNVVRQGISRLAAALSGVQTIGGATYDEPQGIPSAAASEIGILTTHLINYECGIDNTVDPLAGSYYIESLTAEMEKLAAAEIKKVEDMGGIVAAINRGYIHSQLTESSWKYHKAIETGDKIIVGLNKFASNKSDEELWSRQGYYKPNPKALKQQTAKLAKLRTERDNNKVQETLAEVKRVAALPEGPDSNLILPIKEAAKAYATFGEICDALREVLGEFQRPRYF